jgi:hypothetical protein
MRRIALMLLATAAACMSSRGQSGSAPVSDADYGRVGEGRNRGVDEARQQAAIARDELGRAKLSLMDDRHEGELARSDQASAAAERSHAEAEGKIGKDSMEPGQLERARSDVRSAEARKAAADAHAQYAAKLTSSRQALVAAAESKVSLMDEKVNVAKLQALEDAGVPAAARYEHAGALEKVVQAQRRYEEARAKATESDRQAIAAREQWEDVHRRLDAPVGR